MMIEKINIKDFRNSAGTVQDIALTYEWYGPAPGMAPVILINHALTGNSRICGPGGWWNDLTGSGKCIDTDRYSVICFNIPGNGFDGKQKHLISNYREFHLGDIARIFLQGLDRLGIKELFAIIGGSIGGALAWEIAALRPDIAKHLVPIATDLKATDWVIANCRVQDQILNNSVTPVRDARMHAMTFYRTPESLSAKFSRERKGDNSCFEVESWLDYHGQQLEKRYKLSSYKLLNHLLSTIDIGRETGDAYKVASGIKSNIHLILVNTDLLFSPKENWETYVTLALKKQNITISEIRSVHGHDAFLIESSQIKGFLNPIFNNNPTKNISHECDKDYSFYSK